MKRKAGVVIQARMGSRRLPGKVLKEIEGQSLIGRLIQRLKTRCRAYPIVCAIPDTPENIHLKNVCKGKGVDVVMGPEEDVLKRYVMAADQFELTDVVRITADCPLLDPRLVNHLIQRHVEGSWDLTANLTGVAGGFPRGMDVEVLRASTLHSLDGVATEFRFREHVTLYLYERPDQFKINIISASPEQARPDLRLCVDEIYDLEVVRAVYRNFIPRADFTLSEIIAFLDDHPEIKKLNQGVKQEST